MRMSAVSKLSAAMGLALAAMGAPLVANGQVSDGVIKIGVLSDMSSLYADIGGPGSAIARQWYDVDKVDVIVDVPTSSVALAVSEVTKQKGKAFLVSGAASSDLTGKACSPNT